MSSSAAMAGILLLIPLLFACSAEQLPLRSFRAADYAASFKAYSRMADKGDAGAMNFVGIHYYLGTGVPRDFAVAAHWFERAALARDADAARNLGTLYLRGLGVAKNNVYAYAWLHHAQHAGNARAGRYLEQAEQLITPNQTMSARRWMAKYFADHAPERP